jgi:hypothetical protein
MTAVIASGRLEFVDASGLWLSLTRSPLLVGSSMSGSLLEHMPLPAALPRAPVARHDWTRRRSGWNRRASSWSAWSWPACVSSAPFRPLLADRVLVLRRCSPARPHWIRALLSVPAFEASLRVSPREHLELTLHITLVSAISNTPAGPDPLSLLSLEGGMCLRQPVESRPLAQSQLLEIPSAVRAIRERHSHQCVERRKTAAFIAKERSDGRAERLRRHEQPPITRLISSEWARLEKELAHITVP